MRLALALGILVVLAGCSGDPAQDGSDVAADTGTASDGGEPGDADGADGDAAPALAWQVGQSWTWRLRSARLAGPIEATLVVLSADGATYDVGTTDAFDAVQAYPFHLLGLGAVDAATLAWQAHGGAVQFLRFPLTDGDRFTADFWGAPGADVEVVAAEVTGPEGAEPGFRSTAYYAGSESVFMEADYAAARGQFVRVATRFGGAEPFAEATLVREGQNATGAGFRVADLARWTAHGGDPSTLTPRQGVVDAAADIVLLACFMPSDQGSYAAYLSVQSGSTTSCMSQGPLRPATYQSSSVSTVPGQATVVPNVAGQGSITIEAFAVDTTP